LVISSLLRIKPVCDIITIFIQDMSVKLVLPKTFIQELIITKLKAAARQKKGRGYSLEKPPPLFVIIQ